MKTKTLIASACTLLFTVPAMAGASLDTLLGGGSLFSNNGKLVFSDFEFTPIINAPAASDIEILTLDNGLLFNSPISTDANSGSIDFDISYKVAGVKVQLNSVKMQTTGSSTGGGQAGVFTAIENLGNLTNTFSGTSTTYILMGSRNFAPQDYIYVRDEIFATPNNGTAGITDFSQTFDTAAVPTPTAALAGFALLGVVGMRRRHGA